MGTAWSKLKPRKLAGGHMCISVCSSSIGSCTTLTISIMYCYWYREMVSSCYGKEKKGMVEPKQEKSISEMFQFLHLTLHFLVRQLSGKLMPHPSPDIIGHHNHQISFHYALRQYCQNDPTQNEKLIFLPCSLRWHCPHTRCKCFWPPPLLSLLYWNSEEYVGNVPIFPLGTPFSSVRGSSHYLQMTKT